MKDLTKLRELVLSKVDLAHVLQSYGAKFVYNPEHADEAQYHCPVHGEDRKPSARFYRSTQTCYCWACLKKWNAISLVMDKENLNYVGAILHLIRRYKIDVSSIPDAPDLKPPRPDLPEERELKENIYSISIKGKIKELRGKLSFEKYRSLCYAYQMIMFDRFGGREVLKNLKKLESKTCL